MRFSCFLLLYFFCFCVIRIKKVRRTKKTSILLGNVCEFCHVDRDESKNERKTKKTLPTLVLHFKVKARKRMKIIIIYLIVRWHRRAKGQTKVKTEKRKPRNQQFWSTGFSKKAATEFHYFLQARFFELEKHHKFSLRNAKNVFIIALLSLQDLASPLCRFSNKFRTTLVENSVKLLEMLEKVPMFVSRMI